jgi:hypothetical protein
MMAHVHLVLNVEVGLGQVREQLRDVGGNLVPEVWLNQGVGIEDADQ